MVATKISISGTETDKGHGIITATVQKRDEATGKLFDDPIIISYDLFQQLSFISIGGTSGISVLEFFAEWVETKLGYGSYVDDAPPVE